jgi:hypothetical protein
MAKTREISCNDCFFRQSGLCALAEGPCPTFRPAKAARLAPPPQAKLVARPAAGAHAAA